MNVTNNLNEAGFPELPDKNSTQKTAGYQSCEALRREPVEIYQTSDLQNCELINFCCFNLPYLWFFMQQYKTDTMGELDKLILTNMLPG